MVRHQHVHQLRQQDHRVSIPSFFIHPERSKFNQNNIFEFERILVDFLRHSGNNLVNNLRDDAVFCHNGDRRGNHGGFDLEDECTRQGRWWSKVQETREFCSSTGGRSRNSKSFAPIQSLSLSLSVCGRVADPSRVIIEKSRMDQ